MRYVLAGVVILSYTGLLFNVAPLEVLIVWAVVVLLTASAFIGSRRGNRERALQRQIFMNDSLIGYMESVDEDRTRGSDS